MENTASTLFELLDIVNETGRMREDGRYNSLSLTKACDKILDKKLLREINNHKVRGKLLLWIKK